MPPVAAVGYNYYVLPEFRWPVLRCPSLAGFQVSINGRFWVSTEGVVKDSAGGVIPGVSVIVKEDATVTVCHSRTRDLAEVCRRADVLIAAVGVPELVKGDWVKPGATVIDVGINRTAEGTLCGDVDFQAAKEVASWITPVPGGVGPMTIATLLENTLRAAELQDARQSVNRT